ncbi:fused MFS/spermidine synthase [Rickettsiales endosymbiont of Stachyamoeba lipophora]|uniref:fused MFS/spermidine synthase n=1 Tax=Rickettsiales endosymbiont of Stachyamoeba lipophora TaxID=2486578 RepID=UPI000F653F0A|nr:fused MFS/spermidine synthase [Rickettsiales endosymbiont of Stachyamoeba lipophora]AZL15891.1 hypothetical protein EF513_04950 [Rickettsiales endosymbiont of Stachyamoeba lipophora]
MINHSVLYCLIFLEGYIVLSIELLAIRLLIPFVGGGIEVISIIISSILLPLACGYYYAGNLGSKQRHLSIRRILLRNLFVALIFCTLGLSYIIQSLFFLSIDLIGIKNHILQTVIFSMLFLVLPTFLLGQIIPLVSNYFNTQKLGVVAGRILFFSTTGSFAGSILTTVVLMMIIGVNNTVILVMGLMLLLIIMLSRRIYNLTVIYSIIVCAIGVMLNHTSVFRNANIVSNNAYNMISITHDEINDISNMYINHSNSSRFSSENANKFKYIAYIEDNFIKPILAGKQKRILVIGAGGFTLGYEDNKNLYSFVDIDPDLKKVAEEHFLPHKMGPNKKFISISARSFLRKNIDKFDLVILDVYSHAISVPQECLTKEYFEQVKNIIAEDGILVANVIAQPNFKDKYSLRVHNTLSSVFNPHSRQIIQNFDPWDKNNSRATNNVYIYFNNKEIDNQIYTDNKNTAAIDK